MTFSNRVGLAMVVVAATTHTAPVLGQWVEQSFNLQSGWNSIFLEVEPSPEVADELFAGLPIEAVWTRADSGLVAGPPECANPDDPECVPAVVSEWDVWLPLAHPGRMAASLLSLRGGRAYLIRATAPATLDFIGTPSRTAAKWESGFNFGGMYVEENPGEAPTFAQYFAGSPVFSALTVFQVLADGSPDPIADPAIAKIDSGTGYWIHSNGHTDYDGPIRIDNGSLRGIDFGSSAVEHAIQIENRVSTEKVVGVSYTPSAGVPNEPTGLPANAGDVPLEWLEYVPGPAESALQWHVLNTTARSLAGAGSAASQSTLQIAIDRAGLPGATVDSSGTGSQYQGILVLRDGAGFRRRLSVVGQVPDALTGGRSSTGMVRPGLYFGQVTVDQVQWISAGARNWTNDDPNNPTFATQGRCVGGTLAGQPCEYDQTCPDGTCEGFCIGGSNIDAACTAAVHCPNGRCSMETDDLSLRPAPATFTFPLIVHLAADGTYKLLKEVTLLWQPPDEGTQSPGRFVLATPACDPAVCDALEAASIQDGEPFARRLGSAAFSFDGDLPLSGGFALALEGSYTIPEDHPLNPFRHKYHPDHDCDQDGECYEITRSFTLSFSATPPEGETRPGWGDQTLGGTYAEMLTGLHRQPISVGGRFELARISGVSALNAQ